MGTTFVDLEKKTESSAPRSIEHESNWKTAWPAAFLPQQDNNWMNKRTKDKEDTGKSHQNLFHLCLTISCSAESEGNWKLQVLVRANRKMFFHPPAERRRTVWKHYRPETLLKEKCFAEELVKVFLFILVFFWACLWEEITCAVCDNIVVLMRCCFVAVPIIIFPSRKFSLRAQFLGTVLSLV